MSSVDYSVKLEVSIVRAEDAPRWQTTRRARLPRLHLGASRVARGVGPRQSRCRHESSLPNIAYRFSASSSAAIAGDAHYSASLARLMAPFRCLPFRYRAIDGGEFFGDLIRAQEDEAGGASTRVVEHAEMF